jgi:DNA ligase D-like protein (predicted 3'-phosphoesterase)
VSSKALDRYRSRRDFDQTPEPAGGRQRQGRRSASFVVQKHRASSLHYDVRPQAGDVLKSWSVPKGPSTNPRQKRLAMPTEDHPLEYADFEGVIPEGEYGAGTVLVWDRGTYEHDSSGSLEDALAEGHARVVLHGHRLRGAFALTRLGGGRRERWLLVKVQDEDARSDAEQVDEEPTSVLSGRDLDEIAAGRQPRK